MAQEFRRLIRRAVLVPVVVLATVAALLAWQVRTLVDKGAWIDHADQELAEAQRAQKLLVDMETGVRGYLLSGDAAFLGPYEDGRSRMPASIDALAALVAHEPDQLDRVVTLRAQFAVWGGAVRDELTSAPEGTPALMSGRHIAALQARRLQMDGMRGTLDAVVKRAEAGRAERVASANSARDVTGLTALAILVLGAAALALVTRRNLLAVGARFEATLAAERVARGEAEEALRVRETFLQMASHELRTPVTSLRLQIESMLRQLTRQEVRPERDRLEQKASAALRQVGRLERLIAALLDVQRLRATGAPITLRDVDAALATRDAVANLEQEARAAGCTVTVDAPVAPVYLSADPTRLDQVLTNLLGNALKYGRGRPVTITVARSADRVRIAVRDEGIGIAPEDQPRIFERFERAVSGDHFQGFGLGLWIVRSLVERMGGTVSVESARGAGATFTVELPASEEALDVTAAHLRAARPYRPSAAPESTRKP